MEENLIEKEFAKFPSRQIKPSIMQENEEEMTNLILKKFMFKVINGKVIRWILYVENLLCQWSNGSWSW